VIHQCTLLHTTFHFVIFNHDSNCSTSEMTFLFDDTHFSQSNQYQEAYLHFPPVSKCWVVLTQLWVKYGQTQTLG